MQSLKLWGNREGLVRSPVLLAELALIFQVQIPKKQAFADYCLWAFVYAFPSARTALPTYSTSG